VDVDWPSAPDAGPRGADGAESVDAAADDASLPDLGAVDAGARAALVDVAHPRELRGLWLATVFGLDFPSQAGLAAPALRSELAGWVETAAEAGFNALFFQVRPESDALYASTLEPSSRFVVGRQGAPLPLDPLGTLIELAHARALEVHAWINPFRAQVDARSALAAGHVARRFPAHAHRYGNATWMDPGAPEVRAHVLAVIEELLRSYDLDGLHFDDYFYPYPEPGVPFPDDATWRAYQASGGSIPDRDAWRRDNVHQLIRGAHERVLAEAPWVRFGVSPFGIYRPGQPPGIVGLDQYAAIYTDPLVWMREGWVDYLAPQLYWPTTQTAQAFEPLLGWWKDQGGETTPIFPGLFLSRVGSGPAWSVQEIEAQIRIAREQDTSGLLHFRASAVAEDQAGVVAALRAAHAAPSWPPALPRARGAAPPPRRAAGAWVAERARELRAWLLYRLPTDGRPTLVRVSPPGSPPEIPGGGARYAVSVVYRGGRESLGRIAGP
jgi:uncharacterized lipoprotein YddW (UPF0748 family)